MSAILNFKKPAIRKPARAGELSRSVLDIRKAKKILGWAPTVSLKSGVEQTIHFFESRI